MTGVQKYIGCMARRRTLLRGFTLIELLVVIAVIALLVSILLPFLAKSKAAAVKIRCESNHRQLMTAVGLYANTNKDFLPWPNWAGISVAGWLYTSPEPGGSGWTAEFRETGTLWQYVEHPDIYRCPAHKGPFAGSAQITSYLMNGAVCGFGRRNGARASFRIDMMMPNSFILWETAKEGWNDGSSYPDEGLNNRHDWNRDNSDNTKNDKVVAGRGNTISCLDGHVEWVSKIQYNEELKRTPGRLWCSPDKRNGK